MKKNLFGYVLLSLMAVSFVYPYFMPPRKENITSMFTMDTIPLFLGALGAIILWLWMMSNLLKNRKTIKYSTIWITFMFLMNWVAAIVYFFAVFIKQPENQ